MAIRCVGDLTCNNNQRYKGKKERERREREKREREKREREREKREKRERRERERERERKEREREREKREREREKRERREMFTFEFRTISEPTSATCALCCFPSLTFDSFDELVSNVPYLEQGVRVVLVVSLHKTETAIINKQSYTWVIVDSA